MSATNDLHDRIEDVSNANASGPHLVTLAVPPETPIDAALERIEEEHARTEYIDADETSERVTEALERTRRILNEYEETPANGLVVYAGVVDAETVDYTFDDLPSPVPELQYERANEFDTDPLDVTAEGSTYGLIVVEHGKAALGRFVDGDVEPIEVLESDTAEDNPTSSELGDREQVDREFFERVAERAGVEFLGENPDEDRRERATPGEEDVDPVGGVFVGGSSVTASEFLDGEYLDHRLRERVVGDAVPIGDASEEGLEGLAEKAGERIERIERERVEELLDEFLSAIDSGEGEEAVAGREATEEALEYEGVETTLAAEELSAGELRDLEEPTVSQGGEFVLVPTDVDGADQFREEGEVGALIRFPVEE
jgi:peptide chain release factor 1